jgi:hypothetical protein
MPFLLYYSLLIVFFNFIFFIGLPLTVETANSNNAGTAASSVASSITDTGELFVSPPAASDVCLKRKSPPTVVPFSISCLSCTVTGLLVMSTMLSAVKIICCYLFISCLSCDESSDTFIKADYDSKTAVRCAKCNHVVKADIYDQVAFT